MPRDNNVIVSAQGGGTRNAYGYGRMVVNKTTLNNVSGGKNDSNAITSSNLRNVFTIGLGFNLWQKGNELVGAYTNDKLRQRRMEQKMTYAKYGIGIALNPAVGGVYAIGDIGYRGLQYGISLQKRNREAQYYERLSGINSNSGSRYRGDYL